MSARRTPGPAVAPVVLAGCQSYREPDLTAALVELLEPLGGIRAFVPEGSTVLLKPNLLLGRPAERAVVTHPALIAAVGRLVRDAGGKVKVGDSPALEATLGVARRTGLAEALAADGLELVPFGPGTVEASAPEGATFRSFSVAEPLVEADVVINLPKLKTHGQMALSLGVKNTLGCVVGSAKADWHLRCGTSPEVFARMLLDLHGAVAPSLTVLDGVVAMEGNGPSNGTPRHVGLLAASAAAPSLDAVVARLVGFGPEDVPTLQVAGVDAGRVPLERRPTSPARVPALEPAARLVHVQWLPWAPARQLVRSALTGRPSFDALRCTGCGQCSRICPAHALTPPEAGGAAKVPGLDLTTCIRCYCCQEICPDGAVTVREGWLRRLLGGRRRG